MTGVFISYSRRDKAFVQRLHDALKAHDYEVWVDWEDIPPSAEWFEEIRTGVGAADGFVYVITPDSARSVTCGKELETALELNKRVVPVLHRELNGAQVPATAAALNWVFLRDSDDFDHGLQTLTQALETDLDYVRVHTRLGVQATRWEKSGRDRSQLIRGSELTAAEAWLSGGANKKPEATQLQHQYILASRQAAVRRQRTIMGAVSVALTVAIVLAVVALIQRAHADHERTQADHARNVAQVRQLEASAASDYNTDPEQSVIDAAQAARRSSGTFVRNTLQESLVKSNLLTILPLTFDDGGDVIWNPTGTRLLVTNPGARDDWARIYAPGSSVKPIEVPGPRYIGISGWDADGNRIIVGESVYDATTGQLIHKLNAPFLYGSLSPAGTELVGAAYNGDGEVIDVGTGRIVRTVRPAKGFTSSCFALSPGGQYAAIGLQSSNGARDKVAIWDTATGAIVRVVQASALVGSIAFSPSGGQFAYSENDPYAFLHARGRTAQAQEESAPGVFLYDTTGSGPPIRTFSGGAEKVIFSPNGKDPTLAYSATTNDYLVHTYDLNSGLGTSMTGATEIVKALQFDSSGTDLVAGGDDDDIRVYDAAIGGQPIETLAGDSGTIVEVGAGENDHYIASSSTDGTARVWQGPTPIPGATRNGSDAAVSSLSYSPGGRRLIQIGGGRTLGSRQAATAVVLSPSDLKPVATFTAPRGQVFDGGIFSPDGRRILALVATDTKSGLVDDGLVDRNGATGAPVAVMTPPPGFGLFNAFVSREGDQVAMLGTDGRAEVYNGLTGDLEHALDGETTPAGTAAFTNDGRLLAIAHYPLLRGKMLFGPITVQVWNSANGSLEHTFTTDSSVDDVFGSYTLPLAVAFSPDGRLLAVTGGYDDDVVVIDASTGRTKERLPIGGLSGGAYAATLAFSPNGQYLAAGSSSGAYVWTVPGFKRFPTFQHISPDLTATVPSLTSSVTVGFTADSQSLETTGYKTVEIWGVDSQQQLCKNSFRAAVAVSSDGTSYATADADGLREYGCPTAGSLPQLLSFARHRIPAP